MGLDEKGTLQKFTKGLPVPLHRSITEKESNIPTMWQEWVNTAIKYQQKWLYLQAVFKPSPIPPRVNSQPKSGERS